MSTIRTYCKKAGGLKPSSAKGFTLVELLVVMVIIAMLAGLLLPAVRRSRARAMVDKANAEMASFSSMITMVRMDTGQYVTLQSLAVVDPDDADVLEIDRVDPADRDTWTWDWVPADTADPTAPSYVNPERWDGPYQVFQERSVFSADRGMMPAYPVISEWDVADFPFGTPLDPWGRPYSLAYNPPQGVMIIYSSGPNGRFETARGAVNVGDTNNNGTVDNPDSDDIIYRFR